MRMLRSGLNQRLQRHVAHLVVGGAATVSVASPGADPPRKDKSLAGAIQRHDKQAVLSLVTQKAQINAPQSDGTTVLHWAAYLDDAEITALLIRAGAQANTLNNYGVTRLVLAAENGNAAIIEQLLKAGADPNRTVRSGETPLMLAARTCTIGYGSKCRKPKRVDRRPFRS